MGKADKKVKTKGAVKPKADAKPAATGKAPASSKEILAKASKAAPEKEKHAKKPVPVLPNDDSDSDSSDSEPVKAAHKPVTNGKGKVVSSEESSESSSEDEKPKAVQVKAPTKVAAAVQSESDSESDSGSEVKPPPKKSVHAPKKGAVAQQEDTSSSEESSSEDEVPVAKPVPIKSLSKAAPAKGVPVKATPVKSAAPPKKAKDSDDSSEEDSSSSEKGAPAIKVASAIATKPTPSKTPLPASDDSSDSDSDSDSEDEKDVKPAAVAKKAPSSSSSEDSSSDDDSDVEMAEPVPAVNAGKRKAADDTKNQPKKVKLTNGDAAPSSDTVEESKSIFVGRLSWSVDNDRLAQEFAHCGEVVSATVQTDRNTGKSRGFGYVHFATTDAVEKALAMNGQEIDGRPVNIDRSTQIDKSQSRDNRAKSFGDTVGPPSSTLFVGNLSFSVTEDTVWSFFNDYGVKSVRLPTDFESGRPKGFGYVEFEDVDGAKKAFEAQNGADIDGRSIRLDYSQPRDASGGGRGRGGFGGGGRGGFGGGGFGGGRGGFGGGRGGDRGRGRGGDRGGRGRGGDRGRGRGAPRGNPRSGGIVPTQGNKITFD